MEEGNGETEQQRSNAYDLVFRVINKEGISEGDRDFLSHIANIARRGVRCCYFGRFYDESGSNPKERNGNEANRCLAVELNGRIRVPCPFYNPGEKGKCGYWANRKDD